MHLKYKQLRKSLTNHLNFGILDFHLIQNDSK